MDPYRKVQPGERLKVPARAWNALMGGLGERPGFEAGPSQLLQYATIVPVQLTSSPSQTYGYVGIPIQISGCEVHGTQNQPLGLSLLRGVVAEPQDLLSTTRLPAPEMFAVTMQPITANKTSVVMCAIKGLCIARVRIYAPTDRYVALPTRRSASETVASLRGTLESSDAGYGRLVAQINDTFSLISI